MGEPPSPVPGSQASSVLPATNYSRHSHREVGCPPIVKLFDEISSLPPRSLNTSHAQSTSMNNSNYLDVTCLGNQENRNDWVVVNNFLPTQINQINGILSQLGRIIEHNYTAKIIDFIFSIILYHPVC